MKVIAYHGTDVPDFQRFHCLPHFGSGQAAADILRHPVGDDPRIIVAEISMNNLVIVPDNEGSTQDGSFYDGVLDHLIEIGILSRAQADAWWEDDFAVGYGLIDGEGWPRIATLLLNHGIDGLIYQNTIEHIGCVSIAPVHPDQIRVLDVIHAPDRTLPSSITGLEPELDTEVTGQLDALVSTTPAPR